MTEIAPVRSFLLSLAGKVIRGDPFTERECNTLDGFRQAFPDLQNPVHVRCSVPDHRTYGAVVFPDEVIKDGVVGNVQERDGAWICTHCGDGKNVRADVIKIF